MIKKLEEKYFGILSETNERFHNLPDDVQELLIPKFVKGAYPYVRKTYTDEFIEDFISAYWASLGATLPLSTMFKHVSMASRYPWSGKTLTKSEHLVFVYHSFANECYLLSERAKIAGRHYNQLTKKKKKDHLPPYYKAIAKSVQKETKFRGDNTHNWSKPIDHIEFYSLVDTNSHLTNYPEHLVRELYYSSKRDLLKSMKVTCNEVLNVFEQKDLNPLHQFFDIAELATVKKTV